ncbi:MAG: Tetratricopeptide TPR_4 [Rhodanobacteraceae bacterium]|jgi:tetratricopeptide (TPR) repeat protein|nr:MAG: Tetratricopeptide TPR_4 [Rhodanobacteraceae bacterium]
MTGGIQGLDAQAQAQYAAAAAALTAGKPREAATLVKALVEQAPAHPDVLHLLAGIRGRLGDHAGAVNAARQALHARPDDATFCCTLGKQFAALGQLDAAIDALQRACALQPGLAMAWYNLGVLRVRAVRFAEAETALRKTLELAPHNPQARLQLADLLKMAGRVDAAAATWREVLAAHPASGDAWWGLADLGQAGGDDIPAMQAAMRDPRTGERDRIALGFAIARVLDRNDRCAEAMGVLKEIHAHARKLQPWDAAGFARGLDAVLAAFAKAAPTASERGRGAIFIASLPRSGSTLTEQVLAAHSQVEASGELRDLPQVLAEESRQRGRHYPDWVASMSDDDWRRLGERYLERTARWRASKPFSTDKLPGNWLHIGAIRAMLPGAKVIVCRRDPLETCFSCYRQYMSADGQGWTHRFEDLAAYRNGFDRVVQQWQARYPGFVYMQDHENLLADPDTGVRALLAFCGLGFEDACLAFGTGSREVRSPSAMQVREPLRRDTARAPRYGALLDPLRNALGFVDIASWSH